jgi:ergothioneine biosynthesis protein EgtB
MLDLLAGTGGNDDDGAARLLPLIELGLNHEQQHQELLLTDIKHVLSVNPLRPAYSGGRPHAALAASPMKWIPFEAALCEIGATGNTFAFDNEMPRHRTFLHDFQLASRPVTNGEYLDFIDDGGYNRADLWLSLGWAQVSANKWTAPFYWEHRSDGWYNFTLAGMRPVAPDEPACHISYFEAEAYARWAGVRLPSESEWEVAAAGANIEGNFAESGAYHPRPAAPVRSNGPQQLFGDVWEWTQSQYSPYPGFRAAAGALGEYNAKFMCNQFVLRGGSCATPRTHVRPSYRNFFPPEATWQFTGFRLARDV